MGVVLWLAKLGRGAWECEKLVTSFRLGTSANVALTAVPSRDDSLLLDPTPLRTTRLVACTTIRECVVWCSVVWCVVRLDA